MMTTTVMMMIIEETTVKNDDFKPLRQYFAQYASRIPFFFYTRLRHWVIGADVSTEYRALIFKGQEIPREYFSHYQFFLGLQVRTTDSLLRIKSNKNNVINVLYLPTDAQ
jgi:hypothetical protein